MAGLVAIERVREAAERLRCVVMHTALRYSPALSRAAGVECWLKLENEQNTGSFKIRGAYNALALIPEARRSRGVVASSAGNHGLGVARAAREFGIPATIFVPSSAPAIKRDGIARSGARVDSSRPDYDSAMAAALDHAAATGALFVNPCAGDDLLAGQGTVALEILEDGPVPDVVLVPVGGGGLVGGIAVAIKARRPETRVLAVEPELSPALHDALQAGHSVPVTPASAADALSAPFAGEKSVEICSALGVEPVLVSEDELVAGFRWLYARMKFACELGAAASTAAILAGKAGIERGQNVVAVVSGGNVAAKQAAAILAA